MYWKKAFLEEFLFSVHFFFRKHVAGYVIYFILIYFLDLGKKKNNGRLAYGTIHRVFLHTHVGDTRNDTYTCPIS